MTLSPLNWESLNKNFSSKLNQTWLGDLVLMGYSHSLCFCWGSLFTAQTPSPGYVAKASGFFRREKNSGKLPGNPPTVGSQKPTTAIPAEMATDQALLVPWAQKVQGSCYFHTIWVWAPSQRPGASQVHHTVIQRPGRKMWATDYQKLPGSRT